MCEPPESEQHISTKAPIDKNKAATFASLYTIVEDVKGKAIKVDRNIFRGLITAYRAGCEVNLDRIPQHKLMSDTLSLDTTSGILHSANKSLLDDVLTQGVTTPTTVSLVGPSCLLIDGQALMMALARLPNIKTVGDYSTTFANTVYKMGANEN